MNEILIEILTAYLALGVGLWMSVDARRFVDATTRGYLARRGRLPGRAFLMACAALLVLTWPKLVWKYLDARYGVVRR